MTTDLTGTFDGEEMKILTVQEAAEKAKVTPETIRRWITSGRLPAVRIGTGKVVRIDEDDLNRIIMPDAAKS